MKPIFAFLLIIIFTSLKTNVIFAQAVNEQDSLALVDLYNSTNGTAWTYQTNWLTKSPVNTWDGVTVENQRVTNLSLGGNQLSGSIPSSLGNLSNLNVLQLSDNNNLTGNIPDALGSLSKLGFLLLYNNQLSGSIPATIGNMSNLYSLNLFENNLSGSIPAPIGNLSNLHDLVLNGNNLSGNIPDTIGNLLNLMDIFLQNNKLSGNIPATIGNLLNLRFLELSYNQLSGGIPSSFSNLSPVCYLNLSSNQLSFEGMEEFAQTHPYAIYSPQANVPLHQNSNSLYVSTGGTLSNNTYNWFMVGQSDSTIIEGDSVFYPSQYGKYYAAITNSICTQLTLYTDTVEYTGTLPVTIINLKVQQQGKAVKVDWSSLTEINVASYEIQRAAIGNAFSTLGELPAKGNGTLQQNYSFNDLLPIHGNNYYRLKVIDKDGKITYSNIVLVNISNDRTVTIIYPVPTKDILHINGLDALKTSMLSIVDLRGNVVLKTTVRDPSYNWNVQNLSKGMYYLHIQAANINTTINFLKE